MLAKVTIGEAVTSAVQTGVSSLATADLTEVAGVALQGADLDVVGDAAGTSPSFNRCSTQSWFNRGV